MPRKKTSSPQSSTKKSKYADIQGDVFYHAIFTLIAQKGWFNLTMPQIAKATGHTLASLVKTYPDKTDILIAFGRMLDMRLAEQHADSDEPFKDKLFDSMMQRFDALHDYRAGITRLMDDVQLKPVSASLLAFETLCGLKRSMALMLDMVGYSSSHPCAFLAAIGLKVIYLAALRSWKHDTSADLSATMAILDRGLDRLVRIVRLA